MRRGRVGPAEQREFGALNGNPHAARNTQSHYPIEIAASCQLRGRGPAARRRRIMSRVNAAAGLRHARVCEVKVAR